MASTTGQLSQEELRELLPEFQRMTMTSKNMTLHTLLMNTTN
jgi:hypothetical protein